MSSQSNNQDIKVLIKRDGDRCHYCNRVVNSKARSPYRGSRDHVVPRSLGGPDTVRNYVLACAGCNSTRGNELVYCYCDFCVGTIDNWFSDNLWAFANPFRVKVFKRGDDWVALLNGKVTIHPSHRNAMKSARARVKATMRELEVGREVW